MCACFELLQTLLYIDVEQEKLKRPTRYSRHVLTTSLAQTLPGVPQTLPRVNETLPRVTQTLPGVTQTLPGVTSMHPGVAQTLPGVI
jgi:hypothetical protein